MLHNIVSMCKIVINDEKNIMKTLELRFNLVCTYRKKGLTKLFCAAFTRIRNDFY